jgi:hypothetical protein
MQEPVQDWWDISKLPQPKTAIEAGDLQLALGGFATREMLDYRLHGRYHADGWICGFGAVLWLMGDTDGAGRVWSKACDEALKGKFKYSSTGTFQPGLLLWFASVWSKKEDWHEEAASLFDKLLKKKQSGQLWGGNFSSLLAKFLRREIDLSQVQYGYKDQPPQGQASYEWEALFYAGVRAYEDGDVEETRRLWRQAKGRTETSVVLEYYLLEHEKRKLEK